MINKIKRFHELNDELFEIKADILDRACEVYMKIYDDPTFADEKSWESSCLYEQAAKYIEKRMKNPGQYIYPDIEFEFVNGGIELSCDYYSSGETDHCFYHIENVDVLYNDENLEKYLAEKAYRIKMKKEEERKAAIASAAQAKLALEEHERAEYERLKAKYGDK